jgi:hypothetical protein
MYGPAFSSMFTGSMYGSGAAVFAVWTYAFSNCDPEGVVDLNPKMLAGILGEPVEVVTDALAFLQQPDPESRSEEMDGVRLFREGQFQYRVVNYRHYQELLKREAKRMYDRRYARSKRTESFDVVQDRSASFGVVQDRSASSNVVHRDGDGNGNGDGGEIEPINPDDGFDSFWKDYPRKVGKKKARVAWRNLTKKNRTAAAAALPDHVRVWDLQGRDATKIPHPTTWLNGERWEDDLAGELARGKKRSNASQAIQTPGRNYDDVAPSTDGEYDPERWS